MNAGGFMDMELLEITLATESSCMLNMHPGSGMYI